MPQITDDQLKRLELAVDTIERSVEQLRQIHQEELTTPVDRILRGNRIVSQVLRDVRLAAPVPRHSFQHTISDVEHE